MPMRRRQFRRAFRTRGRGFRRFRRRLNRRPVRVQLRRLNRLVKPEVKFQLFTVYDATEITSTFSDRVIHGIVKGTTQQERIGERIHAIGLTVRYHVIANGTGANQIIRIGVVQYKRPNGVAFQIVPNVFQSSTNPLLIPKIHDSRMASKILWERSHFMVPAGSATGSVKGVIKKFHLKLNFPIQYDVADATGTLVETNGLYVYAVSNQSGVGTRPQLTMIAKLTYYDL